MSDLQLFNFESQEVRVLINEETKNPWWVAKDVCDILGLVDTRQAVERLDEDERYKTPVIDSLGRTQETYIINESGLYSLILRSNKPQAKGFKKWVTSQVLPSIRKTGAYGTTPQLPTDRKQLMALALIEADKTIQEQEEAIKVLAPKAEFYDTVGNAEGFHKVSEVAKILGMGSIRLYEWLRANGFLSSSPAHYNLPYQKLVEQGLFVVKESPYEHPKTGEKRLSFTTLVTGKGLIKLQERLKA